MTKLYYGSEAGAAEGWQVPGQQTKGAERIDVPTSPAELAEWLNERGVRASMPYPGVECEHGYDACPICDAPPAAAADVAPCNTADEPAIGNPNRCAKCSSILSATIAGATATARSRDLNAIADWAVEQPDWALERLAEILLERGAEIRNATGRAN